MLILVGLFFAGEASIIHAGNDLAAKPSTFERVDCWFHSPIPFMPSQPFECGYVLVPEVHEDPDSQMIRLPVAILRSTSDNPKPDPLFMAQGGPGGDAFEIFPTVISTFAEDLERDIVIFNQRGTPYAEPNLACPETIDAAGEVLSLPEEEADKRSLEALSNCYKRLSQEGIRLSAYNSLQNAADVEIIRETLGYDQYNFYGVSYGTLLGQHLMRNHPDHLRSVILDGVVPTNLNYITYVAFNTDRVFSEILQFCEADMECSSEYPDLEERFFRLVDELNRSPITLTLEDPETGSRAKARLDGDALVDVLFQAFYLPDSYAIFPKLVDNLENGDFTFIRALWPLFAFNRSVNEGMYFSVICAEDANFSPSDVLLEGIRPYFASGAYDEMQTYLDACAIWEVDQLPSEVNEAVASDIPTLLLSGKYDPITPPSFAMMAAEGLSNGYSFISPTGSHGVAFEDDCTIDLITQFLAVPGREPDASCLENMPPAEFIPSDVISFPFLAEVNQLTTSLWIQFGVAAIFLIGVLTSFIILPAAWLIGILRKTDPLQEIIYPGARRLKWLASILTLAFGLFAIVFISGAAFFTLQALFSGTANLLSISSAAAPFFVIPLILAVLAIVLLYISIRSWRQTLWSIWMRTYFSFIAICTLGYVIVLTMGGMMTVLL